MAILTQSALCITGILYIQQNHPADIISCSVLNTWTTKKMINTWATKMVMNLKGLSKTDWAARPFWGTVSWKKLVLRYVSKTALNYRKLISLLWWIQLGLCQGKSRFLNILIYSSQMMTCVSDGQENPFLLPTQGAPKQRFPGNFND